MKTETKKDLKTAAKLTEFIVQNKQSVFYGDKILKLFLNSYLRQLKGKKNERQQ